MFKFPDEILPVAPEQWHHVCVSYKAIDIDEKAIIKMYLDGIRIIDKWIDTPPNTSTSFSLKKEWKLGYCRKDHLIQVARYTRGIVSQFNVWSRALDDAEMIKSRLRALQKLSFAPKSLD